ncbi:MAG: hypothetical protein M1151_00045 [Candidatus Thermoplasmatota archaeon]|jgi:hypothetical protein|nr:hypothetical protein [Candidatus Thermoplasmatota archaeon]
MLSLLAKVIVTIVLASSGVMAGTAASGSVGHLLQAGTAPANLTSAEQAAIAYVDQHYQGNGTAKLLKVESDTENGTAVVDVTVLAPNGHAYDVEVNQSTNAVMSVELVQNGDQSESSSSDDSQNSDSQNTNNKDNSTGTDN